MRYQMRHRLFSVPERFTITNAADEPVGFVDRELFTFGAKLSITDVRGQEVARIEQKIMTMTPLYEIYRDGYLSAVVSAERFKLTPTFSVDVPGPDDLTIEGDFWAHEYFFVRQGKTVAQVSKQWFTMTDVYGVEVLDQEDHILILASTVVVDHVHERRAHH